MLVEFQQALVDLTASPDMCNAARRDPEFLRQRYQLDEREWRRLAAIVSHPGMACACMVYRANRLAPLALNLPGTCRALGTQLREIASDYWLVYPEANVHFFVESERFCRFLQAEWDGGRTFHNDIRPVLHQEWSVVAAALQESYTEGH